MNMDKCMAPIQIVYTANKAAWLPALVTSLSSLSTVAVFSSSLDCRSGSPDHHTHPRNGYEQK